VCAAVVCGGCGGQSAGATNAADADATAASAPAAAVPHAHPHAIEPAAGAAASGSARVPRVASVRVSSAGDRSLARPESIADIRRQLTQSGMSASPDQATLTSNLLAIAPVNAPAAVQEVIAAGNQIAHLPYIWGGGHI
jgi:hypothetical protein